MVLSGLKKKLELYKTAKALALEKNIKPPSYKNSTIESLNSFISSLNSSINFEPLDLGNGMFKYYINNFDEIIQEIDKVSGAIRSVINHSILHKSMTGKSDVFVKMLLFVSLSPDEYIRELNDDNEYVIDPNDLANMYKTKVFNVFKIEEFNDFLVAYKTFSENYHGESGAYTATIEKITITVIRENAGGCKKDNRIQCKGALQYQHNQARDNNCLFSVIGDKLNISSKLIKKNNMKEVYNNIRSEFNIQPNEPIPISKAIDIFNKYRKCKGDSIKILECETRKYHFSIKGNMESQEIKLEDGHYSIFIGYKELKEKKKCTKCLQSILSINFEKHKCNESVLSYVSSKIMKKGRSLICNIKDEPKTTIKNVIHYDIETYRKNISQEEDSHQTHEPYIVGYDLNDGEGYKTFEGDDCMNRFVDTIIEYSNKNKSEQYYINAYNGANFDHYFIWKVLKSKDLKPDKFALSNGSLVMLEYKNFKCIDLCKHLQGTLSQNLKSFGCSIAKGEFNHDLACRWEDMDDTMRKQVKEYLKADVMGLKELYEKLNATIFDKYKLNLSSYISTSSLTYTLWKQNINRKYFIQLPSLEQEEGFRQSVRGGRCYLSKKRFISTEYDDVISGKKKFNDINDYVVDCDVVSLYPTAMAKYEYPTGECKKYDISKPTEKGVIGIYKIKYTTNKNCQHSIGGRRENGSLKWDLRDETAGAWYTSIDIEDMVSNGYFIEYLEGWYWESKSYIFKDYIEELFKKKEESKKGSVEYSLAKLFMNALYGKTIQRPIYSKSEIIKSNSHYWKFRNDNYIKEIQEVGKDIIVIGEPRFEDKKEKCISKPTHLGAFILAYSRRIMVNYMKEANPYFNSEDKQKRIENDFYYTDTDSLQMNIKNAKLMSNFGGKKLGCIDDDLGGAKIIRGFWIAPKLYMLEYINSKNEIHHHFRGKGLTSENLTVAVFEKMDRGGTHVDTRKFQMKKINIKRNGKQEDIPQFSIVHYDSKNENHKSRLTRTVNDNKWVGRRFIDDCNSIPFTDA